MKISIQDMAHQQPCKQSFDDNDIYALVHQKGVKRMRFLCRAYKKKEKKTEPYLTFLKTLSMLGIFFACFFFYFFVNK